MADSNPQSTENGGCLIQGPFGIPGNPHNFEVVVLENGGGGDNNKQLVHYWRDNSLTSHPWNPRPDQPSIVISKNATSEGGLIFSSYGRLDVLFLEELSVAHYARIGYNWEFQEYLPDLTVGPAAGSPPTGPPTFIQGTYGTPGNPGNFEALVPYGKVIMHWYRNNSDPTTPWIATVAVSTQARGFASLIQSTLTNLDEPTSSTGPGNLEAVVLEDGAVVHYERVAGAGDWTPMHTITSYGEDIQPGSLMQSSYVGKPGAWGNFELLLVVSNPDGPSFSLEHWYRENSDSQFNWITSTPNGIDTGDTQPTASGALIQSSFGDAGQPGNFEIVIRQDNNLNHYYRDNSDSNSWHFIATITSDAVETSS